MTISQILKAAVINPLDAEVLLAHVLNKDRTYVMAYPEHELTDGERARAEQWFARREKHEPVAYILNRREFYGHNFYVDDRVLIPQPSTEVLVDVALDYLRKPYNETRVADTEVVVASTILNKDAEIQTIVDVGTGSGCVGITLAFHRPDLHIILTDISQDALTVAETNVAIFGLEDRVELRHGKGLEPVKNLDTPFLLVSNPPYVPAKAMLMPEVANYEPSLALFGGDDGSDIVRNLRTQAAAHPMCAGMVLEHMEHQF